MHILQRIEVKVRLTIHKVFTINIQHFGCVSIMKTIEIDLDTLNKLKNLKIRPDESLSSVVGRLAVYSFDWEPLTEEFIKKLERLETF